MVYSNSVTGQLVTEKISSRWCGIRRRFEAVTHTQRAEQQ